MAIRMRAQQHYEARARRLERQTPPSRTDWSLEFECYQSPVRGGDRFRRVSLTCSAAAEASGVRPDGADCGRWRSIWPPFSVPRKTSEWSLPRSSRGDPLSSRDSGKGAGGRWRGRPAGRRPFEGLFSNTMRLFPHEVAFHEQACARSRFLAGKKVLARRLPLLPLLPRASKRAAPSCLLNFPRGQRRRLQQCCTLLFPGEGRGGEGREEAGRAG